MSAVLNLVGNWENWSSQGCWIQGKEADGFDWSPLVSGKAKPMEMEKKPNRRWRGKGLVGEKAMSRNGMLGLVF